MPGRPRPTAPSQGWSRVRLERVRAGPSVVVLPDRMPPHRRRAGMGRARTVVQVCGLDDGGRRVRQDRGEGSGVAGDGVALASDATGSTGRRRPAAISLSAGRDQRRISGRSEGGLLRIGHYDAACGRTLPASLSAVPDPRFSKRRWGPHHRLAGYLGEPVSGLSFRSFGRVGLKCTTRLGPAGEMGDGHRPGTAYRGCGQELLP